MFVLLSLILVILLGLGEWHLKQKSLEVVKQPIETHKQDEKKEEVVKPEPPKVDSRVTAIDGYLTRYGAPLAGQGRVFVRVADQYGLDYRLLPAIAMKESSGGRFLPWIIRNDGSRFGYNAFGWTCNSRYLCFGSWEEAISFVGMKLGTASPYVGRDTYGKLYSYNGTVESQYPNRVIAIMNQIGQ